MRHLNTLIALVLTTLFSDNLLAQKVQSLEDIKVFAREFCDDAKIELKGSESKVVISGAAQVKFDELLASLVKAGVDGAATFTKDDFVGLVRADIPKELADRRNCRLRVFDKLIDRFKVSQATSPADSVCNLMGKSTLCIGMPRNEFLQAMLGRTIKWETKNDALLATISGSMYSFSGSETYTFRSDVLTSAQFEHEVEYRAGIDYENKGSYGKPMWIDYNDSKKGSMSTVRATCEKARGLISTLNGQYGAPIEGPGKTVEDLSNKVYEYSTCQSLCNVDSANAEVLLTKYKISPSVILEHYVKEKALAWQGATNNRMRKYDRDVQSCYLNIEILKL